jgi:rod shape-determining protein MreD
MTVWSVAALGLISDFLLGTLLGVNMLTFLVGYRVAVSQRKVFAGAPFIIVWAGFLLMSAAAGLVQWVLATIVREQIDFNARPALFLYMIGAVAYPPCASVFAWIQRRSLVRVA